MNTTSHVLTIYYLVFWRTVRLHKHSQVYIIHCILLMAELFTNVKCTVEKNNITLLKKKEIELYVVFVSKSLCCRS